MAESSFADYKAEGAASITLASGEYYPDILPHACELYKPVLVLFGHLLQSAHSSTDLLLAISEVKEQWMRVQLARVFRKDDHTGQYRDCAQEILGYAKKAGLKLKVIFVNDGPGLLLGSMWNDYARLEEQGKGRVKVVTLRMVTARITEDWLKN